MNYDNINDIFGAGVTNMTCLLKDSGDYDGGTYSVKGADFFTFLENDVPFIYAHGDSYWGFGGDRNNLSVNNRDARMRSLYCEEGTLYSYYSFIKSDGRDGHITVHPETVIRLSMTCFSGIQVIFPFT